jgi:4'-phosphopantetheinyl transferase
MEVPPGHAAVLSHLLDPTEKARADRFRFADDHDAYIVAHALLRVMLSRQAPVAPAAWRFRASPGGKPVIDPSLGQPDLTFSLSHARGMVACAVGHGCDLGVDVEDCERTLPFEGIARRFFAPAEADLIASLPPAEGGALFYRLWTLKEAYTKAIGLGIAAALAGFAFHLDRTPISITFADPVADDPGAWQFAEFRPGPRHRLALAVRHPRDEPLLLDARSVSPNEYTGLSFSL